MLPEYRIKQFDVDIFCIEYRTYDRFLFWHTWSPWLLVQKSNHYEYHVEHKAITFPTEKDAREHIDFIMEAHRAEAERRERLKYYPRIIEY